MEILFYISLFIYWLLFWSFSSVLIHRLKSEEKWIWSGRSHCPKCSTTLKFYDLIPIFSWLSTLWKCRYCKTKISSIYPILEISTAILFTLIWVFLIDINLILWWNILEIIKLGFWLLVWFITILYIFYDILFLEIHEWIMSIWIIIALIWLTINDLWINIIPTINIYQNIDLIKVWISLIFSIITILWLYLIMLRELKIIYDILILWLITSWLFILNYLWFNIKEISILSWLVWALSIFIFFFLQIVLSWWRALWWGDLRIWIMVGLLLWISYSFIWMMTTYIVWSLISIFIILYQKIKYKKWKINTQVPFGPFLWIWFFITIIFQYEINNIIEIYF